MSVLFLEAVIGMIVRLVLGLAQEAPTGYSALGVLLLPFLAAAGAVVGFAVSVGVVMPVLALAGWLGRRFSGREVWWWVPSVAATVVAAPLAAWYAAAGAGPDLLPSVWGWLLGTVALTIPALVARRLLLPDRRYVSGGAMFGRVVLYGTLAVVVTVMLGGIAVYSGLVEEYRPPRLNGERIAGSWTDGRGGTLTFAPDGTVTATGVDSYSLDDDFNDVVRDCTGAGTWEYDAGENPWTQEVTVSLDSCGIEGWSVGGTPEHPTLYVYIGDPDSWDLYKLTRKVVTA
ncbi:hypothetical protein OHA27_29145 [Streptomyces sp. NBC_01619]|uniref:hypothetical protein n=1 Tax=Streptomyces sp. NBC_01619 TaxID=2975901 RepID=UPI00225AF727|nr:hypothetical protein [Streptomyces sp. NBC_01619]MCX4514314.1 hypothetical protein [Streptomyces sp. NBC_01619]